MDKLAPICVALDALESVQVQLAAIATRDDDARKRDLVALRRTLAIKISEIGQVCDPVFTGSTDAGTLRIYRAKFSAMRSAAALHQADWPAVLLDERPDEYRVSAQRVREANKDFVAWVRKAVAREFTHEGRRAGLPL